MANHTFKAGAAQVDVTPPLGTVINGEFTCRYANRIADPLYAKALALHDGTITLLIILVDTCAMQRDFLDEVKAIIQQITGVPPSNQLIASTHTHSAGAVADLLMGHVDQAYRKKLPGLIAKTAKLALERLELAVIGYGCIDQPNHVVCRRYRMKEGYYAPNPVTGEADAVKTNPFGDEDAIVARTTTPDTELRYLVVKGIDGSWISLLANYSLHYVGDCERGTISADYFGYFAHALAAGLDAGETFVGILSNGTSGEINTWDFMALDRYPKGNHEKSRLIGGELATMVVDSLKQVEWESNPTLDAQYADVTVGVRKPSQVELEKAKKLVEATDYEYIKLDNKGLEQVYAREQVLLAEFPDKKSFPIQAIRIGSGIIGALGGEFFSETGLKLKANKPSQKYFTICLANDYVGYVPPAHELEKGGYECWRCRSSHLVEDAEEIIRKELMTQVENLCLRIEVHQL